MCGSPCPAWRRPRTRSPARGIHSRGQYLVSESWWTGSQADFSGGLGGLTEHAHTETCFPLYQVVNGTVRFDVRSVLHNLPGNHARVRIQDGSTTLVQADTPVCSTNDCTFTTTLNVNLGAQATGTHEIRIHTVARAGTPGSGTYSKENLATNGWQLCVRSCTVRSTTVPWPQTEGRGWYDTPSIDVKGYINARVVSPLPLTPVSGRWCPTVRILKGGVEGADDTPVNRSFASIDPDFHAGSAGQVILDQAGTFGGSSGAPLCIETTHAREWTTSAVPARVLGRRVPGPAVGRARRALPRGELSALTSLPRTHGALRATPAWPPCDPSRRSRQPCRARCGWRS